MFNILKACVSVHFFLSFFFQYTFLLPGYESVNFIPLLAEKFGICGNQRKSSLSAVSGQIRGRDAGAIQQCWGVMNRYGASVVQVRIERKE